MDRNSKGKTRPTGWPEAPNHGILSHQDARSETRRGVANHELTVLGRFRERRLSTKTCRSEDQLSANRKEKRADYFALSAEGENFRIYILVSAKTLHRRLVLALFPGGLKTFLYGFDRSVRPQHTPARRPPARCTASRHSPLRRAERTPRSESSADRESTGGTER